MLFIQSLKQNFTGAELHLIIKEASIDGSKNLIKYILLNGSSKGLHIDSTILIGTKNIKYGLNKLFVDRRLKAQFV